MTEREREIQQGLREPSGSLIGGLDVLDYVKGHQDFEAGVPSPSGITSVSYDLGRKRAGEKAELRADVLREVNEKIAADRARLREVIKHRPDLLAEYDARTSEIDSGIYGARSTWRAISSAQKRIMLLLDAGRCLIRGASSTRYDASGEPHALANICGIATVRNLASRDLVAWDGGAFDPERKAVLTERGKFVLKHGQKQ